MSHALDLNLTGKWSVITGGSKGIGAGIARHLAAAGSNVVLVARNEADLDAARKDVEADFPDVAVLTRTADMTDVGSVRSLFDSLDDEFEAPDVLVANAGAGVVTPFLEIPLEEWQWTMDLNLTGVFLSCQLAAQRMAVRPADGDRALLVVSSIRAQGVREGRLSYAVTKAGVNQFVRAAAIELAEHRIRVNALSPGITATPLVLDNRPELLAEIGATVPLGRPGDPVDMGRAALFLCSPAAGFITGANLVVDGGEALTS